MPVPSPLPVAPWGSSATSFDPESRIPPEKPPIAVLTHRWDMICVINWQLSTYDIEYGNYNSDFLKWGVRGVSSKRRGLYMVNLDDKSWSETG